MSQMKLPTTASSSTECRNQPLLFQELGSRKVVADVSGGTLSSDGGVLLLRQVDLSLGLTSRLASCFGDQRHQIFVEHSVPELLAQRLYAQALGYEDVNDHQQLRRDPLLATACGKKDPLGEDRTFHPGPALAGPSTLNRLELSNNKNSRCHKLPHDPKKIQALLVEMGARCLPKHAVEIVIDHGLVRKPACRLLLSGALQKQRALGAGRPGDDGRTGPALSDWSGAGARLQRI